MLPWSSRSTFSFLSQVSQTLAIKQKAEKLRESGKKVFQFGFGQAPHSPPPAAIESLVQSAHNSHYENVQGNQRLLDAVASFLKSPYGMNLTTSHANADNIVIGPGSKELIFLTQAVMRPNGINLLIPAPSWVSYAPQATLLGISYHWLQTQYQNGFKVTPQLLNEYCDQDPRNQLLILNYPNNPSGQTYSSLELEALAKVVLERNIHVLSDEIYSHTCHTNEPTSIAHFIPEKTIITSGVSKAWGGGGWRCGFVAFPDNLKEYQEQLMFYASETFTSVSTPIQQASATIFEQQSRGELQDYLSVQQTMLKYAGTYVAEALQNSGVVDVLSPQGAFYIFPNFNRVEKFKGMTSSEMVKSILEHSYVALLPGTEFGREPSDLCARLCFIDFDGQKWYDIPRDELLDSSNRDVLLGKYAPKIIAGTESLLNYILK